MSRTLFRSASPGDPPPPFADLRAPAAILASGVLVRAALLQGALGIEPIRDEIAYLSLALDWNEIGIFHGRQAPGYPWFLAVLMRQLGPAALDAVKWIQVLILAPVVGLSVMSLAGRAFGPRARTPAGLLWALYLPLAGFTHLFWTETLFLACFAPALVLFLAALDRTGDRATWTGAGAGALLGLAVLLKESATYLPPLLAAFLLLRCRPRRAAIHLAATFLLAFSVVVAPWTLRNLDTYGRFAPVGVTLGENAFLGLNGTYLNYDYTRELLAAYPDEHWVVRTFTAPREDAWERSDLANPVDRSAADLRSGIRYMAARPGYFLLTRVKKLADVMTPMSFVLRHLYLDLYDGWLRAPAARRALAVLAPLSVMALLLLAAAAVCYLPRWGDGGRMLLLTVGYFLMTCMLVSMSRFRAPMLPVFLAMGGALLADPRAVRFASRTRHLAFGIAALLLAGLWSLNADGVLFLVRGIWETS